MTELGRPQTLSEAIGSQTRPAEQQTSEKVPNELIRKAAWFGASALALWGASKHPKFALAAGTTAAAVSVALLYVLGEKLLAEEQSHNSGI